MVAIIPQTDFDNYLWNLGVEKSDLVSLVISWLGLYRILVGR